MGEWLIFHPFGMNNCFDFWTILESHWVTIGLNLITFRLELVTSETDYSIPYKTISSGRDSFLKNTVIMLPPNSPNYQGWYAFPRICKQWFLIKNSLGLKKSQRLFGKGVR